MRIQRPDILRIDLRDNFGKIGKKKCFHVLVQTPENTLAPIGFLNAYLAHYNEIIFSAAIFFDFSEHGFQYGYGVAKAGVHR